MKIVLAPDSFKGSLSARQVTEHLEKGIRQILPDSEIVSLPMADGGEGTAEILMEVLGGRMVDVPSVDPLGRPRTGRYLSLPGQQAVLVELAESSGLCLLTREERNPLHTSTYGTGLLIRKALQENPREIYLTIGGSATNDGGMGLIRALGGRFLDEGGGELEGTGQDLERVSDLDLSRLDPRLKEAGIRVLCDVTSPFYGPEGAARVYGPQKGADPDMVSRLDRGLSRLAGVIREKTGLDLMDLPGSGAAGGTGGGVAACLGGILVPGVEEILSLTRFDRVLSGADLVITGEGRTDAQTLQGKVPLGVLRRSASAGVSVVILSGSLGPGYRDLYKQGAAGIFSIQTGPRTLEEAMEQAGALLEEAAGNLVTLIASLRKDTKDTP